MKRLYYIIKKEMLEIYRDIQSFMILIIMPVVFILVMSLSMQALFQAHSNFKIHIYSVDYSRSPESKKFMGILKNLQNLSVTELDSGMSIDQLSRKLLAGDHKFAMTINSTFPSYAGNLGTGPEVRPVTMLIDPTMQMLTQLVVKNQIEMELSKMRLSAFLNKNAPLLAFAGINREALLRSVEGALKTMYVYKDRRDSIIPSAAQQSVPAWLVFSMYFLILPISTIFHTEKNNGTFQRLRSINIKSRYLIIGKIVSYYIISLVQVVSMLCVGRYLVPLLGGDTIQFGNSYPGLLLLSTCISLNAISYGLLISSAARSNIVANGVGIVLIIILSAIGGIMVPKFVMPKFLQQLSGISPLSWGMEGFLDLMLRNGGIPDIMPECALLLLTSAAMLAATGILIKKRII